MATPETEERLLAVGRAGTADHVERLVRGWRRVDRQAEVRETTRQHASRALHVHQEEDGMVVLRGRLAPEVGALLLRALATARETLYQKVRGEDVPTATIPPALRRALHHRDGGGRFPGCGLPFGQGHHVRHWAQGGPTTLSNLALLCRRHHRAVHEEGYQVDRQPDGALRFRRPDGRPLPDVPPPAAVPAEPVQVLRAGHVAQGLRLHARTACAGWLGERLDVGWAIDVLHPLAVGPSPISQ